MVHHPDIIINKPLQVLHGLFVAVAIGSGLLTVAAFQNGGNVLLLGLICAASVFAASKIKYKWQRKGTVSAYKQP